MRISLVLANAAATGKLARKLAHIVRGGDVLALHGDLGAGKTTLCRDLIQALVGGDTRVPSPTFTLVQEYDSRHPHMTTIRHYDLYRLADESELIELGWDDVGGRGILTLIEWPARAQAALARQKGVLSLFLQHDDPDHPDRRRLVLCGDAEWAMRWQTEDDIYGFGQDSGDGALCGD